MAIKKQRPPARRDIGKGPVRPQSMSARRYGRAQPDDRPRKKPGTQPEQAPETDPAAERGERIETGKTIARGGKTTGHVPGATERKP
jgi:hypothetical protein